MPVYLETLLNFYDSLNGDDWINNEGWWHGRRAYSCDPCNFRGEPWFGISCNERGDIVCIDLDGLPNCAFNGIDGNNLIGSLPEELDLPFLHSIILDHNKIHGEIPNWSQLDSLRKIDLSFNQLEGSIPDFSILKSLNELRLSYNQLSGIIPEFKSLDSLLILTVRNNHLEGCYPELVCDLDLFDAAENALLPWDGDHQAYCDGEMQTGAICNSIDSTASYFISTRCQCVTLTQTIDLLEKPIEIYPNPVQNMLNILTTVDLRSINIYNYEGRLMRKIESTFGTIDVSDLNKGVYFLKLLGADNKVYSEKLIIF